MTDDTHPLAGTTTVTEYGENGSRARRVRIAPCPNDGLPVEGFSCGHELCVAGVGPSGGSQVFCTCGYEGPEYPTDEDAVRAHNKPHGFGIVAVSPWDAWHDYAPAIDPDDLPF